MFLSLIQNNVLTLNSINYTMIHESSEWLATHVGRTKEYWDCRKKEFNEKLNLDNPFENRVEDFTSVIEKAATSLEENPYMNPNEEDNCAGNVPSLNNNEKQIYIFPTQFNLFGQRTKSGVSIVDWRDQRIEIKCLREVKDLNISKGTCQSVNVWNTSTKENETYSVKADGKVILCGGSASPRLLMRSKEMTNEKIGKFVRDHICMPLGIYVVSEKKNDEVGQLIGPKNNYQSIFATLAVPTGDGGKCIRRIVFTSYHRHILT